MSSGHEEALNHLGAVLYMLRDLHPDDHCDSLDAAFAYYNRERPTRRVEGGDEGFVVRLVLVAP